MSLVLTIPAVFDDSLEIRLAGGFFVLCAGVFLILLLPGAAYLRLDPTGFTYCTLFRKRTVAWSDVDGFGIAIVGGRQMVGYDVIPGVPSGDGSGGRSFAGLSKTLSGYDFVLPDTYGLLVAELVELMNYGRRLGLAAEKTAD